MRPSIDLDFSASSGYASFPIAKCKLPLSAPYSDRADRQKTALSLEKVRSKEGDSMPDAVQTQTYTNAYLTQLIEQFARIEQNITQGQTVTLNLSEGDRTISLTVSQDKVREKASPARPSPSAQARSLAENDSLVAAFTNTFSFDIGEANRKIRPAEIQVQITKAAGSRAAHDATRLRPAAEVPTPAVTYDGTDWILTDDCRYTALKGFAVTVKHGFKTDLASIPRILWVFIASFELSLVAPIVHDLIYSSGGKVELPDGVVLPGDKRFDRKEADDLFLELMTRTDVAYWKRNVAYLAVRAFGGSSWQGSGAER